MEPGPGRPAGPKWGSCRPSVSLQSTARVLAPLLLGPPAPPSAVDGEPHHGQHTLLLLPGTGQGSYLPAEWALKMASSDKGSRRPLTLSLLRAGPWPSGLQVWIANFVFQAAPPDSAGKQAACLSGSVSELSLPCRRQRLHTSRLGERSLRQSRPPREQRPQTPPHRVTPRARCSLGRATPPEGGGLVPAPRLREVILPQREARGKPRAAPPPAVLLV